MLALSVLLVLAAGAGCAPGVRKPRHLTPFPAQLALLPLDNHAVSLAAPVLIRRLLEMYLVGGQYHPAPAAEVDEKLRAIGITDGGQVRSVTPAKLGETLGADALLMGEVLTFKYTNIGIYSKREVEVHLKLVLAATGEVLWEDTRKEANSKAGFTADAIKENLVGGLSTELVEKAMKDPLRPESETVFNALMRGLNRTRRDW